MKPSSSNFEPLTLSISSLKPMQMPDEKDFFALQNMFEPAQGSRN
jgi:hypothetical protein